MIIQSFFKTTLCRCGSKKKYTLINITLIHISNQAHVFAVMALVTESETSLILLLLLFPLGKVERVMLYIQYISVTSLTISFFNYHDEFTGNVASPSGTYFTIENRCSYTVWPGIFARNGTGFYGTGGFHLLPLEFVGFAAPPGWLGHFWGRTGCIFDIFGNGKCATGDCAGGVRCTGRGKPPVTVAAFSIGTVIDDEDLYLVSVKEGYNVAMAVTANGGSGACQYAECSQTFMIACSTICTCSRSTYRITFCPYGSS